MTAPATRPILGEFLALTFNPEAAAALTHTNGLVRRLRAMPANLLTPELEADRDRVLGDHLSDLLAAHRDARAAGDASADVALVDGLEHVGEEVSRIIAECQARANSTLATQSRFLEVRYPAAADDPLALPSDTPAPDKALAGDVAGEGPRKLDADALDALLPRQAPRTTAPIPQAAPTPEKRPLIDWEREGLAAIVLAVLAVAIPAGIYVSNKQDEQDALARTFPKQVTVTTTIDSVRRETTDWQGTTVPIAAVSFHGTIANHAKLEAMRVLLSIAVSSCPEGGPAEACKLLETREYYPTNETRILPGLTTRFRHTERIEIPDVGGNLQARVRLVGVSPFEK